MGGGFGGKEETTIGFFTSLLAYHTRRPVKMVWNRQQAFVLGNQRRPDHYRMETEAGMMGNSQLLKPAESMIRVRMPIGDQVW